MDLTPFVDGLRRDLLASADVANADTTAAAERLLTSLDAAVRLALMDALSAAADELTAEIAPGSVDVRLRGREPQFVVSLPAPIEPPAPPPPPAPPGPDADDGTTARISLRLPDSLKIRVEAAAAQRGVSVNSWLIGALMDAVTAVAHSSHSEPPRRVTRTGTRLSGWVR